MDPSRQGGNPNGRGASSNYNPAQPLDHPSSSAPPQPSWLQEARPLPLLTSWPGQLQPQGAYSYSSSVFTPTSAPTPGPAVYQYWNSVPPPTPSTPNVIGSQYQPHHGSAAVFSAPAYNPVNPPEAGVYAQQPGSATVFNAPGYNDDPHASVNLPGEPPHAQPGAATDFSATGGNTNDNPSTSAGLVAPPANANHGASRGPVPGDPDRSRLELLNARANELLVAVQRANTPADVEAIVDTVTRDQHNGVPLMELAEPMAGETALKELVTLAVRKLGPGAVQRLLKCLADGWIMEQINGPNLLEHFFATRGHVQCAIFIDRLAIPRFWEMVTSRIGRGSLLVMCLRDAGDTRQGIALHNTVVFNTVQLASNIHGSILLRTILHTGGNRQLQERIRERIKDNLMELFRSQFGHCVVQACFIPTTTMLPPSVLLLRRGLQAFVRLPDEQLLELLQNHGACLVLSRLLINSEHVRVMRLPEASAEAIPLAEKILELGGAGEELNSSAQRVIDGRPR